MKRISTSKVIIILLALSFIIFGFSDENCPECWEPSGFAVKSVIVGLIWIIGGLYFRKEYLRYNKITFNIESYPILETDEATDGVPFAGYGIVKTDKPLYSPYTKTPCVYYHSVKEKLFRGGGSRDWRIVEDVVNYIQFYIEDKKGRLKVNPKNVGDHLSKFTTLSMFTIPTEVSGIKDAPYSEIDCVPVLYKKKQIIQKQKWIFPTKEIYRLSEIVLKPGTEVFVFGMVIRKNEELVLQEALGFPLIITRKSHKEYIREFRKGESMVYLSYFFASLGLILILFGFNYFWHFSKVSLIEALVIGNGALLLLSLISIYNRLITFKHRARNALSNIEVELKRRNNLVPNLVRTIKGYLKYEAEVQKIIAKIRKDIRFTPKYEKLQKDKIVDLVFVRENYPQLYASKNFQNLAKALKDIEERIVYAREFYNQTVRQFNTYLEQFPYSLVARICGLQKLNFVAVE